MLGFSKRIITLILILIFFSLIKIFLFHPTFSDENFYFNVAKNIVDGKVPYKEFFFAHPPLQVYLLALVFKIFGTSFFVGKFVPLTFSVISVFLTYFILKELYEEKIGFLSALIFIFTPGFLTFSDQAYGMWGAILLFLLSIYFMEKGKLFESSFIFILAVFYRYLVLAYFPFLLILCVLLKHNLKRFLSYVFSLFFLVFMAFSSIFGHEFFNDTVNFQIFSKFSLYYPKPIGQYVGIGFFFVFMGLISVLIALKKKDRIFILLSTYPLIADSLIFFGLRIIFYHYFLISLPLYVMAISKSFYECDDKVIKVVIPIFLVLSVIANRQTLDFYLNPIHAKRYYRIVDFVENRTSPDESIFGEPVITNYISFVTDRRISSNYFDSYLVSLKFEGEKNVIEKLEKGKPKIFIEANHYYLSNPLFRSFIAKNYVLEKKFKGIPNYSIYTLR